jgi:hypothetical protein
MELEKDYKKYFSKSKGQGNKYIFLILTHIKFGIMDFLLAKPLKHWYHTLQSSEIGQYIIIYYCSSPI